MSQVPNRAPRGRNCQSLRGRESLFRLHLRGPLYKFRRGRLPPRLMIAGPFGLPQFSALPPSVKYPSFAAAVSRSLGRDVKSRSGWPCGRRSSRARGRRAGRSRTGAGGERPAGIEVLPGASAREGLRASIDGRTCDRLPAGQHGRFERPSSRLGGEAGFDPGVARRPPGPFPVDPPHGRERAGGLGGVSGQVGRFGAAESTSTLGTSWWLWSVTR